MVPLPIANLMHYKLRSALSALGIAIGICMLVTLSGLSRGSLHEIADRWESVDADVIVYPRIWGENIVSFSGVGLPDKLVDEFLSKHGDVVARITPVYLGTIHLSGQDHMVTGVDPRHLASLNDSRGPSRGRVFQPKTDWSTFLRRLEERKTRGMDDEQKARYSLDVTPDDLAEYGWTELVIDERLARAGGKKLVNGRTVETPRYRVGDVVEAAEHRWKIVGIVPGGMTRVYMHRRTAQFLFAGGDTTKSTLLFVKLAPNVDAEEAKRRLAGPRLRAIRLSEYRRMLLSRFNMIFVYVDMVNGVALIISFLFIMITLYTMVLQRTRDIAILKSSGASNGFILRQVLGESLLLTMVGTVAGVALAFPAAWLIETIKPLLTVNITWWWIALAGAVALSGAGVSALYPAWRATRVDMVEALTLE